MVSVQKKVKSLIDEGDVFLREGNPSAAEDSYQRALSLDSKSIDALYSMGCVYLNQQGYDTALKWAQRALALNKGHTLSLLLLGNALLGLQRYDEARLALENAYPDEAPPNVLGQIGLCYEALGQLEEAESSLRQALADDPAYVTRYAHIAMYSYTSLAADLHHFLARVLQRQGNVEEAKLHYHLSKRIDATVELDPMYREIMSDADLENHVVFDQEPEAPPAGRERILWLTQIEDYEELLDALESFKDEETIQEVVELLHAAQIAGRFYISSKLRVLGDELDGNPQQALFVAVCSHAWKRFLEIAERINEGTLSEDEAGRQLQHLDFDWATVPMLLVLVKRFIELEPASALPLARVTAKLLNLSPIDGQDLEGQLALGKALRRARLFPEATQTLQRARERIDKSGSIDQQLMVLDALMAHYREQDQYDEALAVVDAYEEKALQGGDKRGVTWAKIKRAEYLQRTGCMQEAFDECLTVLAEHEIADTIGPPGALRALAESIAHTAGADLPKELLDLLSGETKEGPSVEELFHTAQEVMDDGNMDEAARLLEQVEQLAMASGNRAAAAQAMYGRGQVLALQGNLDEAADTLAMALHTAEPLSYMVDLWSMLVTSAQIATERDQFTEAEQFLERALAEARSNDNGQRERETLQLLSALLLERDPERAVSLFGESLGEGNGEEERPEDWLVAEAAYKRGDLEEAVEAYERLLLQSSEAVEKLRPHSLANMAIANFQLGLVEEAIDCCHQAASLFAERGNTERAVDCRARVALMRNQQGEDPLEDLEAALEYARSSKSPGGQRSALTVVGEAAYEAGEFTLADEVMLDALEIATSEEWREPRDELTARHVLAKLYRHQCRYPEALAQYQAALECARFLSDAGAEAEINGNMGIALRYLGRLDDAVEAYKHAIAFGDREGSHVFADTHRMNLSASLFLLGRHAKATEVAMSALKGFDKNNDTPNSQRCLAILGQYAHAEDVPEEVLKRLNRLRRTGVKSLDPMVRNWAASQLMIELVEEGAITKGRRILQDITDGLEQVGDRYNYARAMLGWATLIQGQEQEEARKSALSAREIAVDLDQLPLQVECDETLLRLAMNTNADKDVAAEFETYVTEAGRVRRMLRDDADRVNFADHSVRVFDDVAAYYIATDRPGRALEVQDLGRAQALIDLQDQLEVAGPIALCGMQEMLERAPHEAVLLSLSWESDSLVALLLTSTSKEPRVYRTGVTRNNVDALLDIYHREVLLYRGEGIMSWMQRAMPLLAAAADDIPENGVVFLVLEEELQALPIHAIPLADGKRLLDRAAVVYAPNIQLLAQWARVREVQFKPGQEFVCAGVAFQDEALALVQRFGSMGFTGNQLNKNDLAEYFKYARFIHVACHGYFDPENHLESGLVLTNTDEVLARDVLSVRELLDWKFQADLVVLSACETGRGIASASDFLGLSRAFHAAGAHAVMTALWDVENMATQRLMLDFYDRLFSQRVQGHLDAAEALRQAQLNAAKSTSFCDWAAFKLTGWPFFASIQGD